MKKEPPGGIALTEIRIGLSTGSAPSRLLSTRHAPPRTPRSGFTGCAARPYRARNFFACFMRRPRLRRPHPFHAKPRALAPASRAARQCPVLPKASSPVLCDAVQPQFPVPHVPPSPTAAFTHSVCRPLARVRHRIRFRLREHPRGSRCCALPGATLPDRTLPNRLHRHAPPQTSDNCPSPASRRKPKGPSP